MTHPLLWKDGVDDEVAVVGHDRPGFGCAGHAEGNAWLCAEGDEALQDARVAEGNEFERNAVVPLQRGSGRQRT